MEKYIVEDGVTYTLGAFLTDCDCEICEGVRSWGHQPYESYAYLDQMLIGCFCDSASDTREAFEAAKRMCLMFHTGELGAEPEECFTREAIAHVNNRRSETGRMRLGIF